MEALTRPTASATDTLNSQEQAVLRGLLDSAGRVVSRRELARRADLISLSERRCDSLLVAVRRALGPGAIKTVRARGWMLERDAAALAAALLADTDER